MKHGREGLPFRYIAGERPEYTAECECGFRDSIAAPRWLPDGVVIQKFVQKGWVGEGFGMKGVPRKLVCNACARPQEVKAEGEGKVVYRKAVRGEATKFITEAFNKGMGNHEEVDEYIKKEYAVEIPEGTIKATLSRVRREAEAPKGAPVPAPASTSEPAAPQATLEPGTSFAEGLQAARALMAWAERVREAGMHVDILVERDELGQLANLHVAIRAGAL